jgi:hypothetical protein
MAKELEIDVDLDKYAVFYLKPNDNVVVADIEEMPRYRRLYERYNNLPEAIPGDEKLNIKYLNLNQEGKYVLLLNQKYLQSCNELYPAFLQALKLEEPVSN